MCIGWIGLGRPGAAAVFPELVIGGAVSSGAAVPSGMGCSLIVGRGWGMLQGCCGGGRVVGCMFGQGPLLCAV